MSPLLESIKKIFVDEEFNRKMNKMENVEWYLDDEKVDGFIFELEDKGCHYNKEKDWWERTCVVATKNGSETSKEVYVKGKEGWKVVMYGDEGDVFFEQKVAR